MVNSSQRLSQRVTGSPGQISGSGDSVKLSQLGQLSESTRSTQLVNSVHSVNETAR
ncbi:hypothetical protein HanPI659440_Chr05g0187841 [Helianthus annuus]|nr:hypothetical protein HanPI659440_Chr05g0187841 [Helianthus annuus]